MRDYGIEGCPACCGKTGGIHVHATCDDVPQADYDKADLVLVEVFTEATTRRYDVVKSRTDNMLCEVTWELGVRSAHDGKTWPLTLTVRLDGRVTFDRRVEQTSEG